MEEQIEVPQIKPVFDMQIPNHNWNEINIPNCRAICYNFAYDAQSGCAKTYTVYYNGDNLLTDKNDSIPVDLDQPIRPQILAYFGAIFGSNTEA